MTIPILNHDRVPGGVRVIYQCFEGSQSFANGCEDDPSVSLDAQKQGDKGQHPGVIASQHEQVWRVAVRLQAIPVRQNYYRQRGQSLGAATIVALESASAVPSR